MIYIPVEKEFNEIQRQFYPLLQDYLGYEKYCENAWRVKIICGYRSLEDQQKAYLAGNSKCDGLYNYSYHNYFPALAMDIAIFRDKDVIWDRKYYELFGKIQLSSVVWGGHFRSFDGPHFEIKKYLLNTEVQTMLKYLGYYEGNLDGIWGPRSQMALLNFGHNNHIHYNTKINPILWENLFKAYQEKIMSVK